MACAVLTLAAMLYFPRFEGPVPQRKQLVVRKRYWLYYALTFMSGARRQLFIAFGGFLLVKKFGYSVGDMAILMLVTSSLNSLFAPRLGRLVAIWGERNTITLENTVLICVFIGYALTDNARVAAALFIIDGIFFTLTLAQKTYFQKIGDPADMAATASVGLHRQSHCGSGHPGDIRPDRRHRLRHHFLAWSGHRHDLAHAVVPGAFQTGARQRDRSRLPSCATTRRIALPLAGCLLRRHHSLAGSATRRQLGRRHGHGSTAGGSATGRRRPGRIAGARPHGRRCATPVPRGQA